MVKKATPRKSAKAPVRKKPIVKKTAVRRPARKTKPAKKGFLSRIIRDKKGQIRRKEFFIFAAVFGVIGIVFTFLSHAATPVYTPLSFIKVANTANGHVEIHRATGLSNYQTADLHASTWFSNDDGNNGQWKLVKDDLYFIKTKNTGSGRVEIHTATAASGYKSGNHWVTPIGVGDADNGTFRLVDGDLYFIKGKNTTDGHIEVHAVSVASGYQTFSAHSSTVFGASDAENGSWHITDTKHDLVFVKGKNTASGRIEMHIASRSSNYQAFSLHTKTVFGAGDYDNGFFWPVDANGDGNLDLGFAKRYNTGSGKIEVFYALSSNYDALAYAQPSWFSAADAKNGRWYIGTEVVKPAPAPAPAAPAPSSPTGSNPAAGSPAPAPVATGSCPGTGPVLQEGAQGEAVAVVQRCMAGMGYWLRDNGDFSAGMTGMVKDFQSHRGIGADGVIGPQTYGTLYAAGKEGWQRPADTAPVTPVGTAPVQPPSEEPSGRHSDPNALGHCHLWYYSPKQDKWIDIDGAAVYHTEKVTSAYCYASAVFYPNYGLTGAQTNIYLYSIDHIDWPAVKAQLWHI